MKRLNVINLVLGLTAILFLTSPGSAQIATVTDGGTCTTITANNCDGPGSHCTTTNFTVPATGNYALVASIDECEDQTSCAYCLTEAYIAPASSGSWIYCAHNECQTSCDPVSVPVQLNANTTYTLYCCKVDCNGDCHDCPQSCTSRATVQ